MNLNKSQALLLSKVLFNHAHVYPDMFNEKMQDLLTRLNEFLVGDEAEAEDDEEDEAEDPVHGDKISVSDLVDLSAVNAEGFHLEFEASEGGKPAVDVLLDSEVELEGVRFIRRGVDCIEFWHDASWVAFPVKKFSKEWKTTLAQSVIYFTE